MIRVDVNLIPTGIEELTETVQSIDIGCLFPLTPENQKMAVYSLDTYSQIEVNSEDASWIDLIGLACEALKKRPYKMNGEIYPGMQAIDLEEFNQVIKTMIEENSSIEKIVIFGKRINQNINLENFNKKIDVYKNRKKERNPIGHYYMKEHPGYVPYQLAIALDPELYPDKAEVFERMIASIYCYRQHPKSKYLRCFNGIQILFIRPNGRLFTYEPTDKTIEDLYNEKYFPLQIKIKKTSKIEVAPYTKRLIKKGKILYSRPRG